jgi:hypothetical protein
MSQPGAGPAGQPAAQPGTGYPAQPSAGPPGATSFISIKGILIAAAAIVAVVIAAVAAFFLLRPNPPQQTAAQQSPTTAANLPPGAAPAAATSDGPLLRGTYRELVEVRSSAGTSTGDNIVTITSDCPRCDVTIAAQAPTSAYQWNGNGWQRQITGPICPADIMTLTPTTVVDGIVQELSTYYATCNGTVRSSTMTRTGD